MALSGLSVTTCDEEMIYGLEGRKKKRTVSVLTCLSVIVLKSHSLEQAWHLTRTAKGRVAKDGLDFFTMKGKKEFCLK